VVRDEEEGTEEYLKLGDDMRLGWAGWLTGWLALDVGNESGPRKK
jgi:hypothetical protein